MLKLVTAFALCGALLSPGTSLPDVADLPVDAPPVELSATSPATSGTISGTVVNPVYLQIQMDAPGCPPLGNFDLILFPSSPWGTIIGVGSSYLGIPQVVRGYYREGGGAGYAIVAAGYSSVPYSPYHTFEIRWVNATGYLDGGWMERI